MLFKIDKPTNRSVYGRTHVLLFGKNNSNSQEALQTTISIPTLNKPLRLSSVNN